MYINRTNEKILENSFVSPFVTAILGSRRIGKSTLVEHYATETPENKWIFFNMDNIDERQRVAAGQLTQMIEEVAEQIIGRQPKLWICIDEAQKCPELFEQIKIIYDKYKDKNVIKFILTGSGFLSLHKLSAESLAGRIQLYYLREFNLFEDCELTQHVKLPHLSIFEALCEQDDIRITKNYFNELRPFRPKLEKTLVNQLIIGGLPEVLKLDNIKDQRIYFRDYLQTYLEKDVRAVADIMDLKLYQNLIQIVAEQTGSLRDDQRIIQALGCSRNTLKKYRGYLTATLLYEDVYPCIDSSLKRLVKSPKTYLINNGLISYLTGIDSLSVLETTGAIGHRLENWFLKELHVWLDRSSRRADIFFWRTAGGREVDFVVSMPPRVFPFEITYSKQIKRNKVNSLVNFLKGEPKARVGFYVYTGEDFYFNNKLNICFIPAWAIS